MGIEQGFEIFSNSFIDTNIFDVSWIISIIFVFLTLLLITRDINKWKIMALPVTIMWHIVGLEPSFIFYMITAIVFVVEAFSIEIVGNVLEAVSNIKNTITGSKKSIPKQKIVLKNSSMSELLEKLRGKK